MKKIWMLAAALFAITTITNAQRLLAWAPEFPLDNSTLVATIDCNKGNQGLLNFEGGNSNNVYVHVGVITNLSTGPTDWKYVKFTWGTTDPLAKATPLGSNKYQYTITNVRSFFGVPAGETIQKITIIFRNATGTLKQVNSDGSDMYLPVYANGTFTARLNLPPFEPRYTPWPEPVSIAVGSTLNIQGVSSASAALTIKLDGVTVGTASAATTITANPVIATACEHKVILEANNGTTVTKDSFSFYITPATTIAPLPAGVKQGVNYNAGNTSVTLVLFAPNKTNVSVIGDFTNWATLCSNQMNKTPDGNYYWITITGLTAGTEYGYQYLVDNSIKIADPYTEKVLDPNNDGFISAVTYPNLKPYPTGLTTGLVSVLQTNAPAYNWQVTNFTKPDKKNLIIYELLVRDFTAQHSYQSLIDSMQYFRNLGINAIELMPVNEFDGNESWGYNPSFYFAPDKYYGTKNKLKEFIDTCHKNGIAVILDVVYNHVTENAPQAKLYWDAANSRPAANNPWLNQTAPHPYSVFYDFNHTAAPTQKLVKDALGFWLTEYKIDGFRFDLGKGFTQTPTTTTTVENYDASRVANLKRYYDTIAQNTANAYAIIEFLGTAPAQEEQEYAAYGFMLWGNSNFAYNQCTMGFAANSDITPMVYNSAARNFNNPAVVGYSQSHDEERTMYKNLLFGNTSGGYNVKNVATALRQEEAAASVLFTIPGPKQLWQFQERGYDSSINSMGGRLANKPPLWHYMNDPARKALYNAYSKIIKFRLANPAIFNSTSFTYDFNSGLVKLLQIADPATAGLKVTIVANMDVNVQTKTVNFQQGGNWTNFMSNATGTGINGLTGTNFNLINTSQAITLQSGEYHIYVSVPCTTAPAVATGLSTANVTMSSAELNWVVIPGLYYTVDYKPATATTWTNAGTNLTTGSVTLTNLTFSTTYDWRVTVNCNTTVINNYTTAQFSTVSHNSTIKNTSNGFGIKISPNPVTGPSIIDYIVPGNGTVTITVKNVLGQKVAVLLENTKNAGQYQQQLTNQLNRLSRGTYFLHLQQNGKGYFTQFLKN